MQRFVHPSVSQRQSSGEFTLEWNKCPPKGSWPERDRASAVRVIVLPPNRKPPDSDSISIERIHLLCKYCSRLGQNQSSHSFQRGDDNERAAEVFVYSRYIFSEKAQISVSAKLDPCLLCGVKGNKNVPLNGKESTHTAAKHIHHNRLTLSLCGWLDRREDQDIRVNAAQSS